MGLNVPDFVNERINLETVDTNDEWITCRTGIRKQKRNFKGEGTLGTVLTWP